MVEKFILLGFLKMWFDVFLSFFENSQPSFQTFTLFFSSLFLRFQLHICSFRHTWTQNTLERKPLPKICYRIYRETEAGSI